MVFCMALLIIFGLITALLTNAVGEPSIIKQLILPAIPEEAQKLTGKALIDYVNTNQQSFKAKTPQISTELLKLRLMKERYLVAPKEGERMKFEDINETLPDRFDAREEWPECASVIGTIHDQSNCGSCWAASAASAMSDRACTQSKGKIKVLLSDTDILSCCEDCGDGCEGGYMHKAWEYIVKHGVCTGGLYKAKGVCKPYAFHPCGHHKGQTYYGECPDELWPTPLCEKMCQRGHFPPYEKDKIYGKSPYYVYSSEKAIRKEIMKNGPVQAGFIVYTDFYYYESGVYNHTAGHFEGRHAIKIIGWGSENGTDYWLIANSWNTDWGENGYFRILRGENHCGIEHTVSAAMMNV